MIVLVRTSGGIAQLGERLNGIQEVMGSSPTVSIKKYSGSEEEAAVRAEAVGPHPVHIHRFVWECETAGILFRWQVDRCVQHLNTEESRGSPQGCSFLS